MSPPAVSERNAGVGPARPGEFAPLRIGPLAVDPPVVLAPMAGVTNAPFRTLCRRFGAGLYVNQMITARALVERNDRTLELAEFSPDEHPRSIQLYGTDPWAIGEAVRFLVGEGRVDHVDMNFGCPMKKVTRHGGGAALPVRRRLFADIVGAAVAAAGPVPVTIKFRMGIDDDLLTYLDAGRIGEDLGCAAVALHARTAEQLYAPDARWEAIARLAETVTSIPVLGNGDIWEALDAVRMMRETGCDGVVIGRGCLGRPWLFAQLADVFDGREPRDPPTLGQVVDIMLEHAAALVAAYGEHRGVRDFRKHTGWYLQGFPVGGSLRRELNQLDGLDALAERLGRLDRDVAFPPEATTMTRGHTAGPKPVTLPEGWLDGVDDPTPPSTLAEALVSGG